MKSRPHRVAMVVGKMRAGGVESFLMNYYRRMDHERIQFDFIIDEDSPNHDLVPEIEGLGGRIYEVPRYQDLPSYISAVERLMHQQGWSIVHSHINTLSVFPLYAAKRAMVPVRIAHSHTSLAKGEPARDAIKLFLRQFSNLYVTHRFACGYEAGQWLFGNRNDVTIVPNAINLERFRFNPSVRSDVRKEFGVESNAMVLGHIGRFMKQKNHGYLLRVFAEIARYDDSAVLVLVGSGPLKQEIEQAVIEMGLVDRVLFLGQRNDPERLYQGFDIFVLPSLYEGFPVVAIEAQAAGLPCLVSETVAHEAGFSRATKFLPISESQKDVRSWAESAWNSAGSTDRSASLPALFSEFDISIAANKLEQAYERLFDQITY